MALVTMRFMMPAKEDQNNQVLVTQHQINSREQEEMHSNAYKSSVKL